MERYRAGGAAALEATQRLVAQKPVSGAAARRAAIVGTHAAQPQAGSRRIRDVTKGFLGIGERVCVNRQRDRMLAAQ
jgi:hypothetical protein